MSLETEEPHFTLSQAEEKENHDPCQIKPPLSPLLFSLGTLPEDEQAMEACIAVSDCVGAQKKTSLHVRKFFYPRLKPRACGILTSDSSSLKEGENKENCLWPARISEHAAVTKDFLLQTDSRHIFYGSPHELSVRDIANCESPAHFLQHVKGNGFLPRDFTATPNPINTNPAFRFSESPCVEKFPLLAFGNLEGKQDTYVASPSRFVPSPYLGRTAKGEKSHKFKAVLCSDVCNVLMNSGDLTESQPPSVAHVEEHAKENHSPILKSTSKAVIVYRSLKKTRKRMPEQILSSRKTSDAGTGILKTRSCATLDMVVYNRCVRSGPVLRSSHNLQLHGGKMIKKRPLSTYGSKRILVKALLEKYLRNKRLKCGTPSRREVCVPFLNSEAGRRVECFCCKAFVAPRDLISCSHKDCNRSYHLACGQSLEDFSFRKNGDAVCPQHVCMVCKGHNKSKVFRCERCTVAAHKKCFAFPENVIFLESKPDCFICWRHPEDWRLESESCCSTRYQRQTQRKLSIGYPCLTLNLNLVLDVGSWQRFLGMGSSLPRLFLFDGIYFLLRRNAITLMMGLVALVKHLVVRVVNAELNR